MSTTLQGDRAEIPESVLSKIQKLLALTASPNENEASNATMKAQELLTQYKLEIADVESLTKGEEDESIGEIKIKMGVSKWQPWQWLVILSDGIGYACYCKPIFVPGRSISFIGTKRDTEIAKELFIWLKGQIYRLGVEASRENAALMHPLKFRPNFWIGCARRVSDLLFWKRFDLERQNEKVTAIVLSSEAMNEAYTERVYKELKTVKLGQNTSKWATALGYEAGDEVDLEAKKSLPEEV